LGNQVVPQQQLDGCLYGTGRVEIVLLDKLGRGDVVRNAFFGDGL
jgi:hypothetical protein